MFKLTITSNGKNYTDIKSGVEALMRDGIEKIIRNKLAHLESSLDAAQAEIEIDTKNGKVRISNISDELSEKVKAALADNTF